MAPSLRVGHALVDPIWVEAKAIIGWHITWVFEIGFVVGEDEAARAWDWFEFVGGGGRPRGAVVGAHVGAALPEPATEAEEEDAFDPTSHRHCFVFLGLWGVVNFGLGGGFLVAKRMGE